MRAYTGASILLGALLLAACDPRPGDAAAQQGPERIALRAESELGVPVHPAEHAREVSGRIPDGAEVEVLRWGEERRWLEVRGPDGVRGWISGRYLASRRPPPAPMAPSPWGSRGECLGMPAVDPSRGSARIASWNLRWFPYGSSGGPSEHPTDVEWAACGIGRLGADAVAVQELVLDEGGRAAVQRLLARLDAHTGGRWRARFDPCPRDGRQHVGWLLNEARVTVREVHELPDLNPLGGCAGHLRPGLAVDLSFPGGLDLHAINVHLDSGQEARDLGHRAQSYEALGPAIATLRAARADQDVIVVGDFNTMGCPSCPSAPSAAAELARLDALVAPFGLRRVPSALPCTEYYRGHGNLLDHVLASRAMAELAADARVRVEGPCALLSCGRARGAAALEQLSDHCPIVVEVTDSDLDPGAPGG